jgi:hypothetical protein
MAQLFDQVLGLPSGLIGTLVFKRRKGANFISTQPAKRSSLPGAAEIAFRSKFALTGKVASKINSIQVVKDLWPRSAGRASKFNDIFHANYETINTAQNLGSVKVVPGAGFPTVNPVLTAGVSGIQLATDALGVNLGIDTSVEKYIVAAGIIVLQTPSVEGINPLEIIAFKTSQHNLDLINPVDCAVEFTAETLATYQNYTDRKAFACLITLDDSNKPIRYSGTAHS